MQILAPGEGSIRTGAGHGRHHEPQRSPAGLTNPASPVRSQPKRALHACAYLAPAARHLLDRHGLGGGGLFLAPLVGGAEPKGQRLGVLVLLGALVVVVVGSLFGEMAGINGKLGNLWFWLGHQGSEYLDLGRFWQLLLAAGLVFWLVLMFRALRPVMKGTEQGELPSLFLYAAVAIPLFYVPRDLARILSKSVSWRESPRRLIRR